MKFCFIGLTAKWSFSLLGWKQNEVLLYWAESKMKFCFIGLKAKWSFALLDWKQNEVMICWIFVPPMRVISGRLSKLFLSLSLSHWCHCRADRTLSSCTLWHKKRHKQIHSYNYPLTPTQNRNSRSLITNPNQGHLTGWAGGQHLTN
jgi:hypothetical protein